MIGLGVGQTAKEFDPGRHLDSEGQFVKPLPRNSMDLARVLALPAAQLVAYEFVACWAGILPHFDFYPLKGENCGRKRYEEPR
ncbi:hypothetical protein A0H81_12353 [Grifola frondosa]|uniref:Uncharacterized protein n=1 Tax=Grifola frondosa TaxID=5627 RepID=A0A1C7LS76_GRIFR|nr:hypothetical protein A0H81_12353 [Grifola frondosa]